MVKCFSKKYIVLQAVVDVVVNLQFSLIEALWQNFWRNNPPEQRRSVSVNDSVANAVYCSVTE